VVLRHCGAARYLHEVRLAMDGQHADGTAVPLDPHYQGINAFVHATHRRNFLVPPRLHRSFPLAERLGAAADLAAFRVVRWAAAPIVVLLRRDEFTEPAPARSARRVTRSRALYILMRYTLTRSPRLRTHRTPHASE